MFRGAGMPQSQSHRDQAGMPVRVRPSQADQVRICAGVWVVVIVAIVLLLWPGLSVSTRLGWLLTSGLFATLIVAWAARARARRLAVVEGAARQIIESEPRTLGGASRTRLDLGDTRSSPEYAGLASALDELAERLDVQFKEILKKTRNLEALIDAMDEPLLATDNQEHILLCNRSAEAAFDAEPGTLIGRPVREVITQTELVEMHDAARGGQTRRARVRVTTPLGRRTYQVSALPVPVAWGRGVFGAVLVLRDVTELDQSVQIKTDFVANASHELRTPVSAIRTASETLLEAVDDDPAMARKVAGMVRSHALRLEEMLRDLLDLSRLESPDVPVACEQVSFEELGRSLGSLFEPICAQRDLSLEFEFDREMEGARTDRKLVTLILRNLIENASKFAFEGTTIRVVGTTLEVELEPDKCGAARQSSRSAHRGSASEGASSQRRVRGVLRLEVVDRGVGIPLAHQERVFERYYQVDPARSGTGAGSGSTQATSTDGAGVGGSAGASSAISLRRGTGLGLAIVKHAAKRLGGRVGLSSVWGQGTTAWAEIPVEFGEIFAKQGVHRLRTEGDAGSASGAA